jgi:hypothetical protein
MLEKEGVTGECSEAVRLLFMCLYVAESDA